jgi:hypothetical protein
MGIQQNELLPLFEFPISATILQAFSSLHCWGVGYAVVLTVSTTAYPSRRAILTFQKYPLI